MRLVCSKMLPAIPSRRPERPLGLDIFDTCLAAELQSCQHLKVFNCAADCRVGERLQVLPSQDTRGLDGVFFGKRLALQARSSVAGKMTRCQAGAIREEPMVLKRSLRKQGRARHVIGMCERRMSNWRSGRLRRLCRDFQLAASLKTRVSGPVNRALVCRLVLATSKSSTLARQDST